MNSIVSLTLVSLGFALTGCAVSLPPQALTAAVCDSPQFVRRLSVLTIEVGRLSPGELTCFELPLEQGEFVRIAVRAEVGYVRARILDPNRDQLQVTWASSFATAAPSLPLAFEAPQAGRYVVELSVPTWVPFAQAQAFTAQVADREPPRVRAARRDALRQDPRVTWLRANARPLRSIDPDDSDYSDLAFLRDVLRDTRVIVLGEAGSGGGSDVLAMTRLVKFLHEQMGFDVLAFQAGIHSSTVAWQALQADADARDALRMSVFGLLSRSAEAEALIQYLAARARTDRPLELIGFDSQFTGTAGGTLVPQLQAFLADRNVNSPFRNDQAAVTRVLAGTIAGQFCNGSAFPSANEQTETAGALRATAAEIDRVASDSEGARWAQILRSTAVQIDLALNNARGASAAEYMRGFVRQMADNLVWLVNHPYRDRKVIVWTQTLHATRDPEATKAGRKMGYTVGQGLWDAIGPESFAIGFTSYDGRSHWITGADDYYQDLIPGQQASVDFETLMNQAEHEVAFVDLRAARARQEWLGGQFVASAVHRVPEEAEWSGALDALLFIRTQTPRTRAR